MHDHISVFLRTRAFCLHGVYKLVPLRSPGERRELLRLVQLTMHLFHPVVLELVVEVAALSVAR
jgi:hypothetical protein